MLKTATYCLVLTCLSSYHAAAQISLRGNRENPAEKDYNLLIGTIQYNFAAGTNFKWDSNFNRDDNTDDDTFALSPNFSVDAYWPLSPHLIISTGIDIGYDHYIDGEGENGLTIGGLDDSVDAGFDVDLLLSDDSLITVSNSLNSTIDTVNTGATLARTQNNEPFRLFNYGINVDYSKRLTPYTRVKLGYAFGYKFSTTSQFDDVDRLSNGINSELATQLNSNLEVGVEANFKTSESLGSAQNDFDQYQLIGRLTHTNDAGFRVSLGAGLDYIDFDNSNSATRDNEEYSPYLDGSVNFKTGEFLTHTISMRYQLEDSDATVVRSTFPPPIVVLQVNYQNVYTAGYALDYVLNENITIKFDYSFSYTDQSEGGNEFKQNNVEIGTSYKLNPKTSVNLSYSFENVFDSDFFGTDYERSIVELGFSYDF